MSITVGDNFNYQGAKPLDSRIQFASVADMKAYPDASLYDGCIAYVTNIKKNYQYDSSNTVDTTTGKWREFETGGGGGSVPAGGTTGQALLKASNADEDVTWGNVVDAKAFHTDEQISDVVDDVSYFPYMYTTGQSFYKYRMSWGNVKSKLKTYFDQYYSGGGSGTSNYNDLTNKPQIAGIELKGNKLLSQFGLTDQVETQSNLSIDRNIKSYVNRGEKYDWNTASTWYGTCSTSASTTAKSVTLARGTLNFTAGAKIAVKFTYNNTASAPTLTVNSTTKNIKYIDADGNVTTPVIWWNAGDIVEFTYDGTQWLMQPTMQMLFAGQGTKIPREQIYSTSEKVVGCWTDGRPIYQKTISITTPTVSTDGTMVESVYSVGATVRQFISMVGCFTGSSNNAQMMLPRVPPNKNVGIWLLGCPDNYITSAQKNSVKIQSAYTGFNNGSGHITVQYTKTADAANSFNYGDPNDYSTTEKIVGTWIDGRPIYQKTIPYTMPTVSSDGTRTVGSYVSIGASVRDIVDIKAFVKTSGGSVDIFNFIDHAGTRYVRVCATTNSNSSNPNTILCISGYTGFNGTTAYVTLQYTKS